MKKKTIILALRIAITLLLVGPVVIFGFNAFSRPRPAPEVRDVQKICSNYKITSEKEGTFDKKVGRLFVITRVDASLIHSFAHHFEYSMVHAFQLNGIEASVVTTAVPSETATDYQKQIEEFAPDAVMQINVKSIYDTRPDGVEVMVGASFEAILTDPVTGTRVWSETGEETVGMDWIKKFRPDYTGAGIQKARAFQFAEAISAVFVAEINGQEPARIYTSPADRLKQGQPVDLSVE
ncbi:MAG: hypothetical protein JXA82_17440 [Sedimentisphaerales bacterium]|nr:hypothetical protein [Sedimentisphaerales bacterium]